MSICLRRRDFIAGLGGAAVWPLAAAAHRRPNFRFFGDRFVYFQLLRSFLSHYPKQSACLAALQIPGLSGFGVPPPPDSESIRSEQTGSQNATIKTAHFRHYFFESPT